MCLLRQNSNGDKQRTGKKRSENQDRPLYGIRLAAISTRGAFQIVAR